MYRRLRSPERGGPARLRVGAVAGGPGRGGARGPGERRAGGPARPARARPAARARAARRQLGGQAAGMIGYYQVSIIGWDSSCSGSRKLILWLSVSGV